MKCTLAVTLNPKTNTELKNNNNYWMDTILQEKKPKNNYIF